MASKGISMSVEQRRKLAAVVRRYGAEAVCVAANVRSPQSLYRALAGAAVLPMTSAALLASGEHLGAADGSTTADGTE